MAFREADIPGVVSFTKEDAFGWHRSDLMPIPTLGGHSCRFILDGFEDDPNPEDFHEAVRNLLSGECELLVEASPYVFEYYADVSSYYGAEHPDHKEIARQAIWEHAQVSFQAGALGCEGGPV